MRCVQTKMRLFGEIEKERESVWQEREKERERERERDGVCVCVCACVCVCVKTMREYSHPLGVSLQGSFQMARHLKEERRKW